MANPYGIRYATTEDGVSIAYWEAGEGKPLVLIQNFALSHAELEWSVPSMAGFYTELAKRYRLVRFDPRGVGMSSDPPGGWGATTEDGVQQGMSVVEMGLDIEAVSSALRLTAFALFAVSSQVPVAVAFAVRHPGLVSGLILWDGMADVASSHVSQTLDLWRAIRAASPDPGNRPRLSVGEWAPADERSSISNLVHTAADRHWNAQPVLQSTWNVERLLPDIETPTLVICSSRKVDDARLADSRHLAASIPHAHLRTVDSGGLPHWSPDTISELDRFFGTQAGHPPGFRTLVVTDIVGSTEYLETVGDEAGRDSIREIEQRTAETAVSRGGRVIKNMGDGSLVSFRSNTEALQFALDLQSQADPDGLTLRIGMAAGEPLQENGDIHGTVVAQASRIAALAKGGAVAVADSVRQLAIGKPFAFELMGEYDLKGFSEPCRVWKVTKDPAP